MPDFDSREFKVSSNVAANNSSIALLANGNFVVSWTVNGKDSDNSVHAQIFDFHGNKIGGELQINTSPGVLFNSSIAAIGNNFVITKMVYDAGGYNGKLIGQIFKSDGSKKGDEFIIDNMKGYNMTDPPIAEVKNSNGNFVVTWTNGSNSSGFSGTEIYGAVYDSNGNILGTKFKITASVDPNIIYNELAVATFKNGNFVVSWNAPDDNSSGVYAQMFDVYGNALNNKFLVNTETKNNQHQSSITTFDNGNFVVIWSSKNQDGSDEGIFGQLFNAAGNKINSEFAVNDFTSGPQTFPATTVLDNNNFIVTWSGLGANNVFGTYAQKFDGLGHKIDGAFLVSDENKPGFISAVTAIDNNNFIVSWTNLDQRGTPTDISAKIISYNNFDIHLPDYLADKPKALSDSQEFQIYKSSDLNLSSFSILTLEGSKQISKLADGNFIVSWTEVLQNNSTIIWAQKFDIAGNKIGDATQIGNVGEINLQPEITVLKNGDFVLMWENQKSGSYNYFAQKFDVNGNKIGDQFHIDSDGSAKIYYPSLTADINGGFLVIWTKIISGATNNYTDVYAQKFDADGKKIGDEFLVNSNTDGYQFASKSGIFDNGDFVISWSGDNPKNKHDSNVYAQKFDAGGNKIGGEFQVNNNSDNISQGVPSVITFTNGDFIILWNTNDQSPNIIRSVGIYGQKFDAARNKIGSEFQVTSDYTKNAIDYSVAKFDSGGFIVTWTGLVYDGDTHDTNIYAQKFDADGKKLGDEYIVNDKVANLQIGSSVTALSGDDFVVSWDTTNPLIPGSTSTHTDYSVSVKIISTNHDPLAYIGSVNVDEDKVLSLNLVAGVTDADNDKIILKQVGSAEHGSLTVDYQTGEVKYIPDQNFNGSDHFDYTVSDGRGGVVTDVVNITVNPVNDAPMATNHINDQQVLAGNKFDLNIITNNFTDVDHDSLTYNVTLANGNALPSWLSFDTNTHILSGTPPSGFADSLSLLAIANDGISPTPATQSFNLQIASNLITGSNVIGTKINDEIHGTSGRDILNGNAGDDIINGGANRDDIYGGTGNDTLIGEAGNDRLYGEDGNDNLDGGIGNDNLDGGTGNDSLNGGDGNDYLDGAIGIDILTGGSGNDTFNFASLDDSTINAPDVITDFTSGKDQINLSDIGVFSYITNDDTDINPEALHQHQDQVNNVVVIEDIHSNFAVKITGQALLTDDDFIWS